MRLSGNVLKQINGMGVLAEDALAMAEAAAPYTDPDGVGNYRYDDFMFFIDEDTDVVEEIGIVKS